jgi:hypothetical protein
MANEGKALTGTLIQVELIPGHTTAAKQAAMQVLNGLKKAKDAPKYWGYSTQIGYGNSYLLVVPAGSSSALTGGPGAPTTGSMIGGSNVDELIDGLESHCQSIRRSVATYLPDLSNPPANEADAPGPLVLGIAAKLRAGKTTKAKGLVQQVFKALKGASNSPKFWAYETSIGEQGLFYVAIPFNSYGDMDSWGQTNQLLSSASSAENTNKVLDELEGCLEWKRSGIYEYVPDLSNPA